MHDMVKIGSGVASQINNIKMCDQLNLWHNVSQIGNARDSLPCASTISLPKAGSPPSKSLAVGGWKPPLHHSTAFVRKQVLSAEGGLRIFTPSNTILPFHFPLSTFHFQLSLSDKLSHSFFSNYTKNIVNLLHKSTPLTDSFPLVGWI